MGIYVGNDSFEEKLDSMEKETLFLDAWAYAIPIDEVSQNILDIISSVFGSVFKRGSSGR